jgi:alpha-mannosidase
VNWRVQDWASPIGQWNSRLTDEELRQEVHVAPTKDQSWTLDAIQEKMVTRFDPATGAVSGIEKIRPGFKRDEVAWVGTHRHSSKGNEPYILTYIFKYAIDLPAGARAVVLPKDDRIRIFAMTVADDSTGRTRPAGLLYAPELAAPAAARR